ncbi:MAG: anti-sigma factor [Sphingomonas sp.]|uniref:anti-sigma factor n=1 Tax=Sphingomonas sp. TaxID=28214 RepID=UPI003564CF2B
MSDDRTPPSPGDSPGDDTPDAAAAELALGILDGEERAVALRRVLAEPGFAQQVDRWRHYLAQLFDLWPAMPAPAGVLERVEWTIDGPAAMDVPTPPNRRFFWPAAAGISSVAAAVLLLFIVMRPIERAPRPVQPAAKPIATIAAASPTMLVASIAPVEKGAPVTAIYDPASGALRLTPTALADANRSAELWVIGGDGVPHSLGLLRQAGASSLAVNAANRARLAVGATLAVSLEPIGGSPTGLPTGPVVATGALSQV